MPDVMANPDVALGAFLGGSDNSNSGGDDGQAKAPESPKTDGGSGTGSEPQAQPGKETPSSTTADADAQASAAAKEQAELAEEYKPFKTTLDAKKWDPNSKEFAPTVLKAYSELEKAHGQAATDKSMLNTRQTDFQRRLSGDAKSINEYRKANGLPEIPVGKTYAEQAQERAEYFTHINNVLTGQNEAESRAWLNKQLVDGLQDLRIKAGVESERQSKTLDEYTAAFNERANTNYREIAPKGSEMETVFDKFILPLAGPQGLLGSYGLTEAQIVRSPEHAQAWAKIGKALQLAENYPQAVADGVSKGIDEAMAQKRKAGNAGSVGAQGKQTSEAGGGGIGQALWASRHK